jgi:hypothetical protein
LEKLCEEGNGGREGGMKREGKTYQGKGEEREANRKILRERNMKIE